MTLNRSIKKALCRTLASLVMFVQLAVAAYACPALQAVTTKAASPVAALVDGGSGAGAHCEQTAAALDEAAPNLCAEHCRFGQQQSNSQALSQLPSAPVLVALYPIALAPIAPAMPTAPQRAPSADTLAAAFPPHAIAHCCLRT